MNCDKKKKGKKRRVAKLLWKKAGIRVWNFSQCQKRCTILGTPKKSNLEESNWDLLFIIWIAIGPLELIKMRINYFIKLGSFVICYPNWATKPQSYSTVNDWVLDWVNQIESSSTGTKFLQVNHSTWKSLQANHLLQETCTFIQVHTIQSQPWIWKHAHFLNLKLLASRLSDLDNKTVLTFFSHIELNYSEWFFRVKYCRFSNHELICLDVDLGKIRLKRYRSSQIGGKILKIP